MDEQQDIPARIEAAFRRLECFDQAALAGTVAILACLAVAKPSPPPRRVGRRKARKELDDLAAAFELPIARLNSLSTTAVESLGGRHIVRAQARYLKHFAQDARTAEITETTSRGRPRNVRAAYVADVVASAYEAVTDQKIDLPNRGAPRLLEPLVAEILRVLGVPGNAKAAINAALIERGKREGRNNSGKQPPERHGITSEQFFQRMQEVDAIEREPFSGRKMISPNHH